MSLQILFHLLLQINALVCLHSVSRYCKYKILFYTSMKTTRCKSFRALQEYEILFLQEDMFKKIFRQVARPFEYASKAGSSNTYETGRSNIGGQITGQSTIVELKCVDVIAPAQFEQHLRNKGFTNEMVAYFSSLQYVQVGKREKKEMRFNETQASLDIVAVAVYSNGSTMKVAVLKKKCVVNYQAPQVVVRTETKNYGLGYRYQTDGSHTIGRGLDNGELSQIQQALNQEASKHNLAIEAQGCLNA